MQFAIKAEKRELKKSITRFCSFTLQVPYYKTAGRSFHKTHFDYHCTIHYNDHLFSNAISSENMPYSYDFMHL